VQRRLHPLLLLPLQVCALHLVLRILTPLLLVTHVATCVRHAWKSPGLEKWKIRKNGKNDGKNARATFTTSALLSYCEKLMTTTTRAASKSRVC